MYMHVQSSSMVLAVYHQYDCILCFTVRSLARQKHNNTDQPLKAAQRAQ